MKYSLNTILERLNITIPIVDQSLIYGWTVDSAKNSYLRGYTNNTINKISFYETLFLINEKALSYYREKTDLQASAAINSFYDKNYEQKIPSRWFQSIRQGFSDFSYPQQLFKQIKEIIWNKISSDTKDTLFSHRKDIFGDFRFDTVTDKMLPPDLIKTIEILLESDSKDSFIYVILLFILIAIFHEGITTHPVSIVLEEETIESILKIGFNKNEISSSFSNISNEYDQPFGHQQYKNFKIYLYNDTGNYTSDFCSGEIHFRDNGEVTLNFQNEKSMGTTQYSGKAYLFTANKLVHITLEDETTHRGALICFHYTEFKKEPKKCFLRKGLFISTGAADEHYRPYVKNIILLHKAPTQQEFVSGLLKCCNMRNGKEFIIIQKTAAIHFINRLYEFDFMLPLSNSKSLFEQFFDRHEHNNYCFIKENEFLDFLIENFNSSLDEWNHIEIILLLKSFSELPNAIYPYATPDPTFHIFL